jgi:hypothetical protein
VSAETIGPALVLAALAGTAAASGGAQRSATAGIAAIVLAASLVPVGGTSVASYALAFPGVLSAATLVLAAQLLLHALGARAHPSWALLGCVLAAGLLLYPTAAGYLALNIYDLGFRGLGVPALMAVFVAVGWLTGARDVAIWVSLAALLYLAGAYPSVNLWDYLIDPVAFFSAAAVVAARAWRHRIQLRANRANSATTRS